MATIEKASHPALCLFFAVLAVPAQACDWKIASDKVDPMTDERVCLIRSDAAKLAVGVRGESVTFVTGSAYKNRDGLTLRIDDNEAIFVGEHRRSTGSRDNARRALSEIRAGQRLRVSFDDYPAEQSGDAPICTLPELIRACQEPPAEPAARPAG